AKRGKRLSELARVPGLIEDRMHTARDGHLRFPEGWLEREAFGGGLDLASSADSTHCLCMARQRLEFLLVGTEVENSLRQLVVPDTGTGAKVLQPLPAVGGEAGKHPAVALEAARKALAQEP